MSLQSRRTVLVVDDEVNLRKVLSVTLKREGFDVLVASDGDEALGILAGHAVDLVLTDLRMEGMDGLSLLRHVLERHPGIPVVILTAHGTVDVAVEAMKLGAFDFLSKPFDQEELKLVLHKASATAQLSTAEPEPGHGSRFGLVGHSPKLAAVFKMIEKVAGAPTTVLITGESGTGKELAAAAIHRASPRKDKPFIRINCAAIPRDLMESELFGYERGAFTGAVQSKPGRFELADGGSLFLDEIGEIPMEMQVKLLRVLQESELERVGGVTTTRIDVRLIAATNRDLRAEIAQGKFREDLFHRLNVVPIELPPLRARTEDIPLLVEHFRHKYNKRLAKSPPVESVLEGAMACLAAYAWPGNIRELENVMERAVLFADGGAITEEELPDQVRRSSQEPRAVATTAEKGAVTPIGPLKEIIRQHTESLEKDLITRALEETGGNVTQAARRLEISRKSLQNKMKELKLREGMADDEHDSGPPTPANGIPTRPED